MARNQGGNSPEFSVVDVRPTDPIKDNDRWLVNVSTLIKHRSNTPPNPPRPVIFLVDGKQIRQEIHSDTNGRSEMKDIIFTSPGRYWVEAQIKGTTSVRGASVTIPEEEKKKEAKKVVAIEVREFKTARGKKSVRFKAFDAEDRVVKGAVIEIFDDKISNGYTKLPPTDDSGVTTLEVKMGKARERYFAYSCGDVYNTKRLWR